MCHTIVETRISVICRSVLKLTQIYFSRKKKVKWMILRDRIKKIKLIKKNYAFLWDLFFIPNS